MIFYSPYLILSKFDSCAITLAIYGKISLRSIDITGKPSTYSDINQEKMEKFVYFFHLLNNKN